MLAPPVSIASISAWVHGVFWNLLGSSLLSKYKPSGALTDPKECPEWPPIAPYASDCDAEGDDEIRLDEDGEECCD